MSDHGHSSGRIRGRVWRFADCEYEESKRRLWVRGKPAELQYKPLEVLLALLSATEHTLTKDQLAGQVWEGDAEDWSIRVAVNRLRDAFGNADRESIIQTVPRTGYKIAVPVQTRLVSDAFENDLNLRAGDLVPGSEDWKLRRPLDTLEPHRVWLAEHCTTRELHVFKFAVEGVGLQALQREKTIYQAVKKSLRDTSAFVAVFNWRFTSKPFFLETEYCGLNLAEWAESQRNTVGLARSTCLELMADLADALASAHEVGILHNDLKPTNILITPSAKDLSRWQMKIGDFGVAWLSDPGRIAKLDVTIQGFSGNGFGVNLVGSALYLAPEVRPGQTPTTKADIYALGVILFQLLCGDFRESPAPGWEKRIADPLLQQDIAETANVDPSLRFDSAADLAKRLRSLEHRRDRANQQEAERRKQLELIGTAERQKRDAQRQLAADRARRPWMIAAMVVLVLGFGTSLRFARRAAHARDAAIADAIRAKRLEAFTEGLFTDGGNEVPPKGLTVETLLARGVQQARAFNTDRREQAEMFDTLGKVYEAMGLFATSSSLLQSALQEREQVFGTDSPEVASTLVELSTLRSDQGMNDAALALAQRACRIDANALNSDDPETHRARIKLAEAWIELGQYQQAVPLLEAVVKNEKGKPELMDDLSQALGDLSNAAIYLGHPKQALGFNEEALTIDRHRLGDRHPDIGADLINRSQLETMAGNYPKAEVAARDALTIYQGWFAPGHFEIASAETTLSDALNYQGRAAEALPLLTDSLHTQETLFPSPNDRTAHTLASLGSAERSLHHPDAALAYYQRAADQYQALFPDKDYRLGSMFYDKGQIYAETARLPQAEGALREAVAIEAGRLPADDKRLLDARLLLGQVLVGEHRPLEAQPLFTLAYKDAVAGGQALQHERDIAGKALKDTAVRHD